MLRRDRVAREIGYPQGAEILWVEDDPLDGELALESVERALEGVKMHLAHNGEQALARLHGDNAKRSRLPRVVVLDVGLADASGLDILRRIRSHPHTACLPVVVFSSSVDPATVESCYRAGANSYVVKLTTFQDSVETLVFVTHDWTRTNERVPSL